MVSQFGQVRSDCENLRTFLYSSSDCLGELRWYGELLSIALDSAESFDEKSFRRYELLISVFQDNAQAILESLDEYLEDSRKIVFKMIEEQKAVTNNISRSPEELRLFFRNATFTNILEFLSQEESPTCITSMVNDQCLMMNDKFSQDRIIWSPSQYIGLDFKYFWRDSLDEYQRLKTTLETDGFIADFTYKWRRIDESLAEFTKDYYLIENFLGNPARISLSKNWRPLV